MKVQWKLAALVLVSSLAYADDEAIAYAISNFGGAGQCGTPGMTHSVHVNTANAFKNRFLDAERDGTWHSIISHYNSFARGSNWTDASKEAGGMDTEPNFGVDTADVIYIHTHGGHSTTPAYSSLSMGNSAYDCSVRTDQDMLFGNPGDLDIAIIKACQSADYDTWNNGGYLPQLTDPASGFSVWNGFHGDSSCGNHVTSYVDDYTASSFHNGVGENWLDEAYDNSILANHDDCPVSIVFGATKAARDHMYEFGGFEDRENTGSKTSSTYYFISNCDPDNGRKLP